MRWVIALGVLVGLMGCSAFDHGNIKQNVACYNACHGVNADDGYVWFVSDGVAHCICRRTFLISQDGTKVEEQRE